MCLKTVQKHLFGAYIFDSPLLLDIILNIGGGHLHNMAHPLLARSHPVQLMSCKLYTEMGAPFMHLLCSYGKGLSVLNDVFSLYDYYTFVMCHRKTVRHLFSSGLKANEPRLSFIRLAF